MNKSSGSVRVGDVLRAMSEQQGELVEITVTVTEIHERRSRDPFGRRCGSLISGVCDGVGYSFDIGWVREIVSRKQMPHSH